MGFRLMVVKFSGEENQDWIAKMLFKRTMTNWGDHP